MSFASLRNGADQVARTRLVAAATKESGACLHTFHVPSLGTQLDPESLRVAVALRVGTMVYECHKCQCGRTMDKLGHHGLSCHFSANCSQRHTALNDVVKHAIHKAGVSSVLEPFGLDHGESICPGGLSIVPYKNGRSLSWD